MLLLIDTKRLVFGVCGMTTNIKQRGLAAYAQLLCGGYHSRFSWRKSISGTTKTCTYTSLQAGARTLAPLSETGRQERDP